mgnify:CR=1 FL=1
MQIEKPETAGTQTPAPTAPAALTPEARFLKRYQTVLAALKSAIEAKDSSESGVLNSNMRKLGVDINEARLSSALGFQVAAFQHVLEGYKVADEIAAAEDGVAVAARSGLGNEAHARAQRRQRSLPRVRSSHRDSIVRAGPRRLQPQHAQAPHG